MKKLLLFLLLIPFLSFSQTQFSAYQNKKGATMVTHVDGLGKDTTLKIDCDTVNRIATKYDISQLGSGSGTVTSLSAGNLSPLFTTSVANSTTTPALSFSLTSVGTGNKIFASPDGSGGAASFRALVSNDIPALNYQSPITTGTTSQYFRGDLSLATFPTNVSSFANDAGYLTSYTETDPLSLKIGNDFSDLNSPSLARGNLGATTVGSNLFTLSNPSAVSFLRVNADNTITARSAANTLSDIGGISLSNLSASSPISYNNSTGAFTTSMGTGKLIGRSTSGAGVMEEITVGSGLSLSGGTLSASGGGGSITGSGSADQVTYWDGSSSITGSSDFVFDGANLGVGTSSPASTVDITGTLNVITTTSTGTFLSSGGTVTYADGYTIHTFTSGGTFTAGGSMNVECLIVAGGGGGGGGGAPGGGGGAGGVIYQSSHAVTAGAYTITVGAGGATGSNGSNSVFDSQTAVGGGAGYSFSPSTNAGNGGSGGGGGFFDATGGTGTASQGNAGGNSNGTTSPHECGGGGGAGTAGATFTTNQSGNGGDGLQYDISGTNTYYGGGGGGAGTTQGATAGTGGLGGGGNGSTASTGASGTANTGGGGGGSHSSSGGAGGSGIVIIRYLTPPATALTTDLVGRVGIGVTPTAFLHLPMGQANAGSAALKFETGILMTTPEAGSVEFDGTDFYATPSSSRHKVARVLTGSATLDFGNLAAIGCEDLTLTVTGAATGDCVSIGVPNSSVPGTTGSYSAWVSSSNTVTIRYCDLVSGNPASGTFKATVIKN